MIRSLYTAVKVEGAQPPFDTVHLKVFYPAAPTGSDAERMTGVIPADAARGRMPVVLFFNGINIGADSYAWLAIALARQGIVVALFNWVGETLPGVIGLTNGLDLARVTPQTYGSAPTVPAIAQMLTALARLDQAGPLQGALALDRVVLGGHSAGGTVALHNANPRYFPQVVAGFSYAGHTMAATMLGFPPGTVLACASDLPLLLMGGGRDGVIAASGARYGQPGDPVAPLHRTFDEGIEGSRGDRHLVIWPGANHFTLAHPLDETAGRSFLDLPPQGDESVMRAHMTEVISAFILGAACNDAAADARLRELSNDASLEWRTK
ncbi:MAG: alpha/beta hydrolase family protein [Candidatus Brachytrichaceae bacterium NZ_4S206]|jgi:predicted dienelactone hydrolase